MKRLAVLIALAAVLLALYAVTNAHAHVIPAQAGNQYNIQCMMLAGCWYHPAGGYPDTFWMWHPIYAWLQPHQYTQVYQVSDWRWIPVEGVQ